MLDVISDALPGLDPGAVNAMVEAGHGDPFAVLGPHDGARPRLHPRRRHGERDRAATPGWWWASCGACTPPGSSPGPCGHAPRLPAAHPAGGGEPGRRRTRTPSRPCSGIWTSTCSRRAATWISAAAWARTRRSWRAWPACSFAVWAPNAQRVSVVGDFNGWDGRRHPMRKRHGAGVWELFVPRIGAGRAVQVRDCLARGGETGCR